MNKKMIVLIFIILISNFLFGQSNKANLLNEIKRKAIIISSIDFTDEVNNDLKRLIPILRNVRVIGLGENSHNDGSTFKAKMRLIKFLHEEMGFEVLAFESSFYGSTLANAEIDGRNSNPETVSRNIPGWFHSKHVYPLLDYAKNSRNTKHPLILAGFDDEKQPTAVKNGLDLVRQIYNLVYRVQTDILIQNKIDSFIRGIHGPIGNPHFQAIKNTKTRFEAVQHLKKLLEELERNSKKMPPTFSDHQYMLYKLALRSILMTDESMTTGIGGVAWNVFRDNFMAKRIQWLTDSLYPGKKIILWAATGHLIRNNISITRNEFSKFNLFPIYPYYQTGDYLQQFYGDKYYSVAFTSYEGEIGLLYPGLPQFTEREYREPLPASDSESFESLFHQLKKPYLFFDLRNSKSNYISNIRLARPLGYTNDKAIWPKIIDAFFFIDKMEPDIFRKND